MKGEGMTYLIALILGVVVGFLTWSLLSAVVPSVIALLLGIVAGLAIFGSLRNTNVLP